MKKTIVTAFAGFAIVTAIASAPAAIADTTVSAQGTVRPGATQGKVVEFANGTTGNSFAATNTFASEVEANISSGSSFGKQRDKGQVNSYVQGVHFNTVFPGIVDTADAS